MELRHLRYFVAVAEELNFSRAAERLHMAQPPLSQQIRQLEAELGVELFHRNHHGVRLTQAGAKILEEARRTLFQAGKVGVTARRVSAGEIGNLRIGFSGSAPYTMLPTILRRFRSRFPEVTLTLCEHSTEEQMKLLAGGTIDLGFLRLPVEDAPEALTIQSILQEPLVLAIPQGHGLSCRKAVPLRALAQESFIHFPRHIAPGLYDVIAGLCRRAGFQPKVTQEATQMQTIVSLVSAGLGIAIVPSSIQNLQRRHVLYRRIAGVKAVTGMAIAYEKENNSVILRSFLRVLGSVARP